MAKPEVPGDLILPQPDSQKEVDLYRTLQDNATQVRNAFDSVADTESAVSTLETAVDALSNSISAETASRTSVDNSLSNAISVVSAFAANMGSATSDELSAASAQAASAIDVVSNAVSSLSDTVAGLGGSLSNVIFQYIAAVTLASNDDGEAYSDSLYDGTSGIPTYRYLRMVGTTERTLLTSKWKKISGVDTLTVYGQLATDNVSFAATLKVDVGGANNSNYSISTTFEWVTFTIDVSGLSDGTVYDVSIIGDNASNATYIGTVVIFGS